MSDFNSTNDQMLEMFVFEMSSLVEHLDEILLTSEKNQALTAEDIGEVFRIMHTIKGSSAMMDFNAISAVTHKLEDSFFIIRDKGIEESHFTELFDLMLDATDFLKQELDKIQNGQPLLEGNDELIGRATAFYGVLSGNETSVPKPKSPVVISNPESIAPKDAVAIPSYVDTDSTYCVEVWFEEDCGMENLRSLMLINALKPVCNILRYEPEDIENNPDTAEYILINGFTLYVQSDFDSDTLQKTVEESMHVKSAHVEIQANDKDEISHSVVSYTGDIHRYAAEIMFDEDCGMENLRSFMLVNSIRAKCNVLSYEPADIESNPDTAVVIMEKGFKILLESGLEKGEMQELLDKSMHVKSAKLSLLNTIAAMIPQEEKQIEASPQLSSNKEADVEPPKELKKPAAAEEPLVAPKAAAKQPVAAATKPVKQNIINVNLSKLDSLMDLMGELVIAESMVTRSPDLRNIEHLDDFHKAARQLRKLTDELQDMVMSIRMVPVDGTFQKMQRIVRDMSRSLEKEAELITMGEETDIDKTIIDGIADPIMHLVRNSMDHGVELPEDREALGKLRKGTITLSAQNTGGEILITVSDDGKGLDADKLIKKAQEKGILTKSASDYTEKEAFQLLMSPGFSTKENVTEYSGRGVGMDVVKKNIEKVGGTVHIESKKGHGMSVFLKIPLTLAIVDGMDISVGGGVYTLQITAISESFKATKEQVIVDTDGNEMIMIRGSVHPVIRLHELYNIPNSITEIDQGILILVQAQERSACLFVDQLIGEQQIVVKPLPKYLSRFDVKPCGISGCTILGDGNISLILDVGSIIDTVLDKR